MKKIEREGELRERKGRDIDDYDKQRLATLKRLKRGEVEEKPKTGEGGR